MIVTIVCEVLGVPNNGTSIASMNLINYLRSRRHEVRVVCPDDDKRGLPGYYVLPKADKGLLLNYLFKANKVVLPGFDETIMRKAMLGADLVHIMIPLFIARQTTMLAKSLGIPVTAGFHAQAENFSGQFGPLMDFDLANRIIYRWYDNNVFKMADAIHYPTQFIRDIFEGVVGRKTNGYVISNGVNREFRPIKVEKPEQLKDKFCILFTGRFSREKSHKVLVKAVSKSKYQDKIQLFFAGCGVMEKSIANYSKRLTNQPVMNFYSRKDLLEVINMCDLYCHPAEVEIEAISCLEAISCGLVPIIANSPKCATKAFAMDERSLFKVNDADDLAKKIDYFIENPSAIDELREKYLKSCLKFDFDVCMQRMEEMMIKTINDNKKK